MSRLILLAIAACLLFCCGATTVQAAAADCSTCEQRNTCLKLPAILSVPLARVPARACKTSLEATVKKSFTVRFTAAEIRRATKCGRRGPRRLVQRTITEETCTVATIRESRIVRSWRTKCGRRGPWRLVARVRDWQPGDMVRRVRAARS